MYMWIYMHINMEIYFNLIHYIGQLFCLVETRAMLNWVLEIVLAVRVHILDAWAKEEKT